MTFGTGKSLLMCCLLTVSLTRAFRIRCNVQRNIAVGVMGRNHNNRMMMHQAAEASRTHSHEEGNGAYFSKRGISGPYDNRDRALVVSPFLILPREEGDTAVADSDNNFIVGVFDGHSGREGEQWADFASQNFSTIFSSVLKLQSPPPQPSWDAAIVVDSLTTTFQRIQKEGPRLDSGGSTASLAIRLGNKLYLANVGNSRTFVATYDTEEKTARIIHQTDPHTPKDPTERARIEQCGTTLYKGDYESITRVCINEQPWLAMSRSLGAPYLSLAGIIPDPTVVEIDLTDLLQGTNLFFVVSATVGLFREMTLTSVADYVGRNLSAKSSSSSSGSLKDFCEDLVERAWNDWRGCRLIVTDDITMAVHVVL